MKCKEVLKEILPFYCGELDESKEKEYKRHTTVCSECARISFKLREAKSFLENSKPVFKEIDLADSIKIKKQRR